MRYDLNFWEEPNWRRESSVDPLFAVLVGGCLFILLALVLTAWLMVGLQVRKSELGVLELEVEEDTEAVEEVHRQMDCMRVWREALAEVDVRRRKRVVWSRQLNALQSLVPDAIVLRRLSLSCTEVEEDDKKASAAKSRSGKGKKPPTMLSNYELRIQGVAHATNAEALIATFSRVLPEHPELAPHLDTVELTSVTPDRKHRPGEGDPGKEFMIVCRYKPIKWSR